MRRRSGVPTLLVSLGALMVCAQAGLGAQIQRTQAPSTSPTVPLRDVLDKYCVTCHNARLKTAGLLLDALDVNHVGGDAALWEKVASKLRTREMPPAGRPRPDQATYEAMAAELENSLDAAAAAHLNPGRVAVHRLNRAEYTNAVRDLLGLQVDGASLLMADEPDQHGFDNIANLLSVSTARLERYMSAARRISRLAIGNLLRA